MRDLFVTADPLRDSYARIYDALVSLRESFHRTGRLDDSNAKLDEVAKIFATYLAFRKGHIRHFPDASSRSLIRDLQLAFLSTAALDSYRSADGESVFGSKPSLILREGDEATARGLVALVRESIDSAFMLRSNDHPFDIINEAFGHFVRENFRGNIEDAQYMTPPEVVDFMVDLAFHDLKRENYLSTISGGSLVVVDPTCGVGSFLTATYHHARISDWLDPKRLKLFGQDKVERMVRLSAINMELFDVNAHRITFGNSLELGSPLDALNGTVDLILTNPPFGARFSRTTLAATCNGNTPFFSNLSRGVANVDSELLFLDRNLRLLKNGGRLLMVVPDGVISARGAAALLRHHLGLTATIRAVVELPATTFAQAGTRTKTAVLYAQKGRMLRQRCVFMGVSKDLGFQVSSHKGVQIKTSQGRNDLIEVSKAYRTMTDEGQECATTVLSHSPSCVLAPYSEVLQGSWTPSHYDARRYTAVNAAVKESEFELVPLSDLADLVGDTRRVEKWRAGCAFISVLHILGEGFVDVAGALSYAPKTPGVPVKPGELIVSRINPRIPRVCVVPDFGVKTLCSSEFEILNARQLDVYTLVYLLQTHIVQAQIRSFTSGTSASHNRIRSSELGRVLIPVAKAESRKAMILAELVSEYRQALEALASNAICLAQLRAKDAQIFPVTSLP